MLVGNNYQSPGSLSTTTSKQLVYLKIYYIEIQTLIFQVCDDVPVEHCVEYPQEECTTVPKEECEDVKDTNCRLVPKEKCNQKCEPVYWCKVCT